MAIRGERLCMFCISYYCFPHAPYSTSALRGACQKPGRGPVCGENAKQSESDAARPSSHVSPCLLSKPWKASHKSRCSVPKMAPA